MQTLYTIMVWMFTLAGLAFFFAGATMLDTIQEGAIFGITTGLAMMAVALLIRVVSGDKPR